MNDESAIMIEQSFSAGDLKWSFSPLAEFDAHSLEWDAVNQQAGGLPFMQSLFIRPLLRHNRLSDGLIAVGHLRGKPTAAALLVKAGIGRMATLQPSQLPLGAYGSSNPPCRVRRLLDSQSPRHDRCRALAASVRPLGQSRLNIVCIPARAQA